MAVESRFTELYETAPHADCPHARETEILPWDPKVLALNFSLTHTDIRRRSVKTACLRTPARLHAKLVTLANPHEHRILWAAAEAAQHKASDNQVDSVPFRSALKVSEVSKALNGK